MTLTSPTQTMTIQEFQLLRDFIYARSGIFFNESKQYFLENRLGRRLADLNLKGYREYLDLLNGPRGREELKQLFIEVTTNETSFWRNPPQIESFQRIVLQDAADLARTKPDKKLRIWSAACSSGEEPYTLAMICAEAKDTVLKGLQTEIIATDISEKVLAQAIEGAYGSYTLRNLTSEQIKRHFLDLGHDTFQVKPELKAIVSYRNFNLVDYANYPSLGSFEVIFCRNVLIYFDNTVKINVLKGFHDRLHPKAYLLVGHSESIHAFNTGFELMHFSKAMGYRKRG